MKSLLFVLMSLLLIGSVANAAEIIADDATGPGARVNWNHDRSAYSITQNADPTMLNSGTFTCGGVVYNTAYTTDGWAMRRFPLQYEFGINVPFTVSSVDWGVRRFVARLDSIPGPYSVTVLLYSIAGTDSLRFANMTLIDSVKVPITPADNPVPPAMGVAKRTMIGGTINPNGYDLVVAIHCPEGYSTTPTTRFALAASSLGQTAESYYAFIDCGYPEPVTPTELGQPGASQMVIRVNGDPAALGACCPTSGACSITAQVLCPGVWQGENTVCVPNPCPPPPAVCCDPSTGACTVVFQANCVSPSVWHPEWTTCVPNLCPQPAGACCDPLTGACTIMVQAQCAPSSVWFSEWTTCEPNPCPPPVGACCAPDGGCTPTVYAACPALNVWLGGGTSCEPNLCPQPVGACCMPYTCAVRLLADCVGPGWTFFLLQPCTPILCEMARQVGACCMSGGECHNQLTKLECVAADGVFLDVGTVCTAVPCASAEVNVENTAVTRGFGDMATIVGTVKNTGRVDWTHGEAILLRMGLPPAENVQLGSTTMVGLASGQTSKRFVRPGGFFSKPTVFKWIASGVGYKQVFVTVPKSITVTSSRRFSFKQECMGIGGTVIITLSGTFNEDMTLQDMMVEATMKPPYPTERYVSVSSLAHPTWTTWFKMGEPLLGGDNKYYKHGHNVLQLPTISFDEFVKKLWPMKVVLSERYEMSEPRSENKFERPQEVILLEKPKKDKREDLTVDMAQFITNVQVRNPGPEADWFEGFWTQAPPPGWTGQFSPSRFFLEPDSVQTVRVEGEAPADVEQGAGLSLAFGREAAADTIHWAISVLVAREKTDLWEVTGNDSLVYAVVSAPKGIVVRSGGRLKLLQSVVLLEGGAGQVSTEPGSELVLDRSEVWADTLAGPALDLHGLSVLDQTLVAGYTEGVWQNGGELDASGLHVSGAHGGLRVLNPDGAVRLTAVDLDTEGGEPLRLEGAAACSLRFVHVSDPEAPVVLRGTQAVAYSCGIKPGQVQLSDGSSLLIDSSLSTRVIRADSTWAQGASATVLSQQGDTLCVQVTDTTDVAAADDVPRILLTEGGNTVFTPYTVIVRDGEQSWTYSVDLQGDSLLVLPAWDVTVVPEPGTPGGHHPIFFTAQPNPFAGTVAFTLPGSGVGKLEIFDLGGRRLRCLDLGAAKAGVDRILWDGRDEQKKPVPAGVYVVRLSRGSSSWQKRIVHIQ